MTEKVGVKETKELIRGVFIIAGLLIKKLKDGFQIDDLATIMTALAVDPAVREALEGLGKLPTEFSDLDSQEIVELVIGVVMEVPGLLSNLKAA